MRRTLLLAIILLTGCESPPQQPGNQSTGAQAQPAQAMQSTSPGLVDSMITSAVGGAAAGAGAAVAHQAASGLMDKWRVHSRLRRINKIRTRRR